MKRSKLVTSARFWGGAVLLAGTVALGRGEASAAAKQSYRVAGTYVEGCSCGIPCGCMISGLEKGCAGVGAVVLKSGNYMRTNLAGAKVAYATLPGSWVRLYVDAKNPAQQRAVSAFARNTFSAFGKIEQVKPAKVNVTGSRGTYKVDVDGGKIMQLSTQPVLGGDKKTPVAHTNMADPLNDTYYQARTIKGSFKDGNRQFELKASNSYFNDRMNSRGKV